MPSGIAARDCPDANALAEVFAGELDDERSAELDRHLDLCADCRLVVSQLARGRAMPELAAPDPGVDSGHEREATSVDRYLLLEQIGVGGMGVVYSAYDPELDRRVAIKLLHGDPAGGSLLREAQAIARIAHQNVISVFDVGVHGDDVFLAMELVAGATLAGWLRQAARSTREILGVFVQAGRGLAAAHAAGVVHGDFKPDNVLVGRDGVVRVTDFGLSRRHGEAGPRGGTAAFMAPELRDGGHADTRSDQYAYCVALGQALASPPARLQRIIARGTQPDPGQRFPRMELLIEALERDPARTRRRIGGALGLLVLMGLGGAVLESRFAGAPGETCSGAPARIAEVWSPDRQRAVHAAFLGSRQPYAEATWKAFERGVDRYRAAWAAMHTDACVATRVRGDQSEQLLDLRMACLEERRRELDAFVRVYEAPDPAALESAAAAVQRLSAIEACGDLASLRRGARPAPDLVTATRRAALRSQLAEAKALDHAYQWTPGLAIARGVVASARGVGDPALVADALLVEGDLLARSGDARAAEPVLYDAIAVADAGGADDLRVSAWIALMRVVGRDQAKLAQARVAASLARAVSDRLGASPQRSADLALALTPILLRAGEIDEAERTARDAVALEQRIGGADNLELGRALDYLASVELAKGHYPAAAELYARNLTIIEKSLGTDHPNAAAAYDNRGIAAWSAGRYDDALADHRRAIAIRERVLGPDHPDLAVSLCNAANALLSLGEPAQAARSYERAIAIFEHARGADHPTLASFRLNLGSAYAELGRTADARAQYQRALAIQLRALGPSHGDVGLTLAADAELFLDEHHDAEALAEYRRSLAIFEAALGREHPNVATALVGIGRSELGLGHRALATAALERAVAIDLASSIAPEITAEAQFALARALGGGARAMDLASAAARGFAHLGPAGHRQLVEVQQWLAAR